MSCDLSRLHISRTLRGCHMICHVFPTWILWISRDMSCLSAELIGTSCDLPWFPTWILWISRDLSYLSAEVLGMSLTYYGILLTSLIWKSQWSVMFNGRAHRDVTWSSMFYSRLSGMSCDAPHLFSWCSNSIQRICSSYYALLIEWGQSKQDSELTNSTSNQSWPSLLATTQSWSSLPATIHAHHC